MVKKTNKSTPKAYTPKPNNKRKSSQQEEAPKKIRKVDSISQNIDRLSDIQSNESTLNEVKSPDVVDTLVNLSNSTELIDNIEDKKTSDIPVPIKKHQLKI